MSTFDFWSLFKKEYGHEDVIEMCLSVTGRELGISKEEVREILLNDKKELAGELDSYPVSTLKDLIVSVTGGSMPGRGSKNKYIEYLLMQKNEEVRKKLKSLGPEIHYLSGIYQLDYITGTYEGVTRRFYLFYDMHHTEGECPVTLKNTAKVNDWLLQRLSHHSKFIDLFLEIIPRSSIRSKFATKFFPDPETRAWRGHLTAKIKYDPQKHGTLMNLSQDLERCFDYKLFSKCPYRNVRVHFVDVRKFSKISSIDDPLATFIFLWNFLGDSGLNKSDYVTSVMKEFVDKPESKIYKEWTKTVFADWKNIVVRLLEIHYDLSLQAYSDWKIFEYMAEMKRKYSLTHLNYENIPVEVKEKIFNLPSYEEIMYEIIMTPMFSVLQDIYTIARMFKRFSGEPEYAKNIIYYAGGKHSELVQRFLLEVLGFELQYQTTNKATRLATGLPSKQCVDIKELPWVF